MIKNPVTEFSRTTVACFHRPLSAVWQEMRAGLEQRGLNVMCEERPMLYEAFGPEPAIGGLACRKGGLIAVSDCSAAMITNIEDGWATLATMASKRLSCVCWLFSISQNDVAFPLNSFTKKHSGVIERVVMAQLDTRWVFFQKGTPLDIEVPDMYQKRQIRDRVSREYVIAVAMKAGFPIGEDEFWRTGTSGLFFSETGKLNS